MMGQGRENGQRLGGAVLRNDRGGESGSPDPSIIQLSIIPTFHHFRILPASYISAKM